MRFMLCQTKLRVKGLNNTVQPSTKESYGQDNIKQRNNNQGNKQRFALVKIKSEHSSK